MFFLLLVVLPSMILLSQVNCGPRGNKKRSKEILKTLESEKSIKTEKKKHSTSALADAAIRADEKAAVLAMVPAPLAVNIRPEPTEIVHHLRGGLNSFNLQNVGEESLAFKVKCSDVHLYRVRPATGFIKANDSVKIEVLRQNGQVKKDKLVILFTRSTTDNPKRCFELVTTEEMALTVLPLLVNP